MLQSENLCTEIELDKFLEEAHTLDLDIGKASYNLEENTIYLPGEVVFVQTLFTARFIFCVLEDYEGEMKVKLAVIELNSLH